jgi:hypothetical protein
MRALGFKICKKNSFHIWRFILVYHVPSIDLAIAGLGRTQEKLPLS